jgi:light-regulated signal transduction histidine kinase (bacteriophytochrome)
MPSLVSFTARRLPLQKQYIVETRQDAYGPFFTDHFAHEAFEASNAAASLKTPIFDLVADWRSASYAGALPAQIPSAIKHFHDAFVNTETPPSGILQYSEAILAKLSREIPELVADPKLQRKLQEKVVALSCEIVDANASVNQEMDGQEVWKQYLELHPFQLGLHGTLRLVYLAVYGAYENFLVRVLSIAHGGKRIRITDSDFKKDFRSALGPLIDSAWFAEEIKIARLVRNSLVHAGGRVTDELRKCKIPLVVHDDSLNVFPEHVSDLYNALKVPALAVMRAGRFQSENSEQNVGPKPPSVVS